MRHIPKVTKLNPKTSYILVMRRFLLHILFLLAGIPLNAQYRISGIIMDKTDHEKLAFVTVISTDGKYGTTTDIEGRFTLETPVKLNEIKISYIGYKTLFFQPDPAKKQQEIYLERGTFELAEVAVEAGENPAHRIIENAIENRNKNNPEKSVDFRYKSYNKLYVTLAIDTSLISSPEKITEMDSSSQEAIRFFRDQHLFIAESVTERIYKQPGLSSEKVLASKVSGFENPVFNLLATELQSFTIYTDYIQLGGEAYESPLGRGATRRYYFEIRDTSYDNNDTIYHIYFQPKKNKKFNGLKGTVAIHTNGFAVYTFNGEPATVNEGALGVKISQRYENISGQWFPVQLNTKIYFRMVNLNNFNTVGIANGYLEDIEINPPLTRREFGNAELTVDENASARDSVFWEAARHDSLNQKEIRTYHTIDSIAKEHGIERRINFLTKLSSGRVGVGPVDIELDKLINYNSYEKLRLGFGLSTNEKISNYIRTGAYFAYGFGDKAFKYGGNILFELPKKAAGINFYYKKDIAHSGGVFFPIRKGNILSPDLSILYMNRYDRIGLGGFDLYFRFARHFSLFLSGNGQERNSFESYYFSQKIMPDTEMFSDEWLIAEGSATVRFQYKEKFMETNKRLVSAGSPFPVAWLKVSHGFSQLWKGELEYNKIDFSIEKKNRLWRIGSVYYRLDAGWVDRALPYGLLYNPKGTYRDLKNIAVYSVTGFETMRTNEFLTDSYIAVHFMYETLVLYKKAPAFKPQLGFVQNFLKGTLQNPELHHNVEFSIPDKGFFESGMVLNSILSSGLTGIGAGVFYRYGSYQLPENNQNFAYKLTLTLRM